MSKKDLKFCIMVDECVIAVAFRLIDSKIKFCPAWCINCDRAITKKDLLTNRERVSL